MDLYSYLEMFNKVRNRPPKHKLGRCWDNNVAGLILKIFRDQKNMIAIENELQMVGHLFRILFF